MRGAQLADRPRCSSSSSSCSSSSCSSSLWPEMICRRWPLQPSAAAAGQRPRSSSLACGATLAAAAQLQQEQQQQLHLPHPPLLPPRLPRHALAAAQPRRQQQPPRRLVACRAAGAPDPWQQQRPGGGNGNGNGTSSSSSSSGAPAGATGAAVGAALESYDPWDDAAPAAGPAGGAPRYEQTDWGWGAGAPEEWDPAAGLAPQQLADLEADYAAQLGRRRAAEDPPRDKWITPLLDWRSVFGAFDPDQSRTEEAMADEALTNKEESREALSFAARLVVVPLVAGALVSRAVADPVLGFSLQNNPNAFAMSEHQKLEGAQAVHMEEARVRMMVAIGQAPPLSDAQMLSHLVEYAKEVQEEERQKNEASLMTLLSDSVSAMVFFAMFLRDTEGRSAVFCTIGRLFEGLSDIAKAVLIILVADTLLGYHSEEGWTGLIDLVLGHYGIEVEEENIVLFVGVIPIAIDVLFKWWIFIGLNKISPGAVVTIKQLDRH